MIHTLTLNPAIDRTYVLASLVPETVNRAAQVIDAASGKGMNVLRVASALAAEVRATVPLGGHLGGYFRELCEPDWSIEVIPIAQNTRLNVSIFIEDSQAGVIKINENGPELSQAEVDAVLVNLNERLNTGDWLAICGSTPSGVAERVFLEIRDLARTRGVRLALDVPNLSPPLLLQTKPSLFKPNLEEFEQITETHHKTVGDLVESVHRLAKLGDLDYVIVTLGSLGALMVHDHESLYLPIRHPTAVHPIGAGDALLAGFLTGITRGSPWRESFALGVAASYAVATSSPTNGVVSAAIEELDASLQPTLSASHEEIGAIQL